MRIRARADLRSRITDGRLHQSITPLEAYCVIEVDHENYRVMDDKGEPILYPKALFKVVDPSIPPGWQLDEYEDGEFHLRPTEMAAPGFYEDFFCSDGDKDAQKETQRVVREVLEAMMKVAGADDRRLIAQALERLRTYAV